jgi:hypothetical protein
VKNTGEQRQRENIRRRNSRFPFGNSLKRNADKLCQLLLREALLFSQHIDIFSDGVHNGGSSLPVV